PYPVDNEVVKSGAPTAADALALIPFQEILNRQVLQITGLTAPAYDLFIDDQQVGRYSPEQLAAGIDLALNPLTPQYQQARRVMDLNEQRWNEERKIRHVEWVSARIFDELGLDPKTPEEVDAALAQWTAGDQHRDYHQRYIDIYRRDIAEVTAFQAQVEQLEQQVQS